MNNQTKAANLNAAFNEASRIAATSPGLAKAEPTDVAAAIGELAAAIYAERNALFEGEDLDVPAPAPKATSGPAKSGGKSWTSGGGSDEGDGGVTGKQKGFAKNLLDKIAELGGSADIDYETFRGLSKEDGTAKISELIELRDSLEQF